LLAKWRATGPDNDDAPPRAPDESGSKSREVGEVPQGGDSTTGQIIKSPNQKRRGRQEIYNDNDSVVKVKSLINQGYSVNNASEIVAAELRLSDQERPAAMKRWQRKVKK
jgi:uncharacterized protein YoaH (UPF0181 family)